jgi:hypothetical protein
MGKKLSHVLGVIAGLLLFSGAVFAHHGVAGYDMAKTITLHGTVSKFDWSNPHCVIFVDVKNDNSEIQHWALELASPTLLARAGWDKNSLKPGDDVMIDTHPSKNGATVGITSTITFILKVIVNGQPLPTR